MKRRVFTGLVAAGIAAGLAWVIAPFTDIWGRKGRHDGSRLGA